mmetsp:Transcript_44481/g.53401  ORF Transcript_44481/g.53401 Transcript_44481/m.53401 type:complete len:210 (+) Transcript_44481:127-756(+)
MPAAHPILTQKQCVDYSFMEIKDVRDIMMNKSESETDDANKDTKRGNQPSNSVLEVPPASQDEENSIHKLSNIKSLKLNSNEIKSLVPLYQCLNHVIKSPSVIQWVDLSNNIIESVPLSFEHFDKLSILYLHGNKITEIKAISGLSSMKNLTNLTLHGNPIENHKHYRNYILHLLPNLTKLDFSIITKQNKEDSRTWENVYRKKLARKK